MAHGGGTGRRIRGESPAVLGGELASARAALSCLGGAFVGSSGMDSVVGPAAALDEGVATHQAHNHFLNLIIQIQKKDRDLTWPLSFW